MDISEALTILGVASDASWDAIRLAHRTRITATHPDVGGSAASAARVNQAYDVLRAATDGGRSALPRPAPPPTPAVVDGDPGRRTVALDDPVEVLLRLSEVAHDVGEVVFVDPDAGLLEVIVGAEPGVGQLTASVDVDAPATDGVPVAFTLEPLGVAAAPPIAGVVDDLMRTFRHARARDSAS